MGKIYLLRHGQVDGPAALYGNTDIGVASWVNDEIVSSITKSSLTIDHIVTSPLKRCHQLAELLSQRFNCSLSVVDALKEMYFGYYDGIAFDDIYQENNQWSILENFWHNPVQHPLPKAELLTGFSFRVRQAWRELVEQHRQAPANTNYLLVCHGGVIRMILAHLLNVDYRNPEWYTQLSIANGSLTTVTINTETCLVEGIAKPLTDNVNAINDDYVTDQLSILSQGLVK
ncbi:histidine phosphatase family protein [Thalassotalea sp. G2M2-11]|uniref:histidine phosphatase family protein n=1 Tax=Thalassotalea sp. G2M2-11 TaxID=2787627 RepID=UPI0019D31456|nr:histidine phosphatase family protein [Thalassotalea sp. G2M2-11]